MFGVPTVRQFLITIGLCLVALSSAAAQSMVSVKGSTLNMRSGPSTKTEVLWELKRGYPLKVIQRKGRWLKVRDFEEDSGWVARSLTGSKPHHVVKSRIANVRKSPTTKSRVVGKAEYGELLQTQEKKGKWVRVKRANGKTGWIAKSLLWGF